MTWRGRPIPSWGPAAWGPAAWGPAAGPRLVCLGLVAALAAGCGGRDPVSPLTPTDVVGTYALHTIDAQSLPWPFPQGNGTTLVADTLTVAADGTWTEVEHDGFVANTASGRTATYNGTWTLDVQNAVLRVTQSVEGTALTSAYQVGDRGGRLTVDTGTTPGRLWTWIRVQ